MGHEQRYGPAGTFPTPYQAMLLEEQMQELREAIAQVPDGSKSKKSKAAPEKRTGQNGPPLELPANRLNEIERKLVTAMVASTDSASTLTHLALICFPGDLRGASKVRNGLRRLIRGAWLIREARGKYRLTALG